MKITHKFVEPLHPLHPGGQVRICLPEKLFAGCLSQEEAQKLIRDMQRALKEHNRLYTKFLRGYCKQSQRMWKNLLREKFPVGMGNAIR